MPTRALLPFLASVSLVWAGASLPVLAQSSDGPSITLQIGSQAVRIPVPPGFVETSRRSQDLWAEILAFTAGDARIIAHFVPDKDIAEFEKGATIAFKQFLLVQTPRRAEALVTTQVQFDKLRAGTVALQANLSQKIEPRLATELDRVSKAVSSNQFPAGRVRPGELVSVSVDRNDARVLIYTVLSQGGVSESKSNTSQIMVTSTAYCFVAGKVPMLTAYRHLRTPQDLQASRTQVTTWANSVLASN